MKVKSIIGVPVKADGSVFAIKFLDDQNKEVIMEIPGTELHGLARLLQAAAQHVQDDKPQPIGTEKSFLISRYEIGAAFPGGVSLVLHTQAFGRMGFVMDTHTAQQIARDLQECVVRTQEGQSTPNH